MQGRVSVQGLGLGFRQIDCVHGITYTCIVCVCAG